MNASETLTALMNGARNHFSLTQKLSISNLISLFNPNPNLLTGTKDFKGSWEDDTGNPGLWSKADIIHCENNSQNTVMKNTGVAWHGLYQHTNLEKGTYTFSIDYYVNSDYPSNGTLAIYIPSPGVRGAYSLVDKPWLFFTPIKGKWARANHTFTVKQPFDSVCRIESNVPSYLYVSSYKLEKGDLATPWVPASSEKVGGG